MIALLKLSFAMIKILTDRIKALIEEKNALYKRFFKNSKCKFMFNRLAFLGEKIRK